MIDGVRACLRGIALRPVRPELHDALFEMLVGTNETARRWRFRGDQLTREEFDRRLGDGVHVNAVGVRERTGEIVSYVVAYDATARDAHCHVGVAVPSSLRRRTGVGMISLGLLIDALFLDGGFRKLYAEATEENLAQYASAVGKLFEVEGCLRGHERRDGGFRDVYVLSLWRERWLAQRGRYGFAAL